ncbi:ribbon-helix-helix protein, CopG family [Cellulomonas shaoxiangyii]|uniref:ribbon-helix-helix protein, CopG family n=1 Tax=Cellulomonas shaoxiangyii TaxID=2566013 RepID=UPI00140E34AE|nr:ribbon-helix-helix protein, CopG family [Cellulomonas shaoxiangyii]
MTATTIKLDSDLRDRLNAAARERGVTTGSFVEALFEGWLREQRFAALREEMARTPPDAAYAADADAWDVTLADR